MRVTVLLKRRESATTNRKRKRMGSLLMRDKQALMIFSRILRFSSRFARSSIFVTMHYGMLQSKIEDSMP